MPNTSIQWDLQTCDPDQVRSLVSEVLTQYRLNTFLNKSYNARLLSRQFPSIAFNLIEYGDRAGVNTDVFENFAAIQMPIRGSFQSGTGKSRASVNEGQAQILFPDRSVELDCSANCSILVMRFDDPFILSLMKDIQSKSGQARSRHNSIVSLKHGSGRSLGRLVNFFAEEFTAQGLPRQNAKELLRDCVISILKEKLSGSPGRESRVPHYIRHVELYIFKLPDGGINKETESHFYFLRLPPMCSFTDYRYQIE